MNGGLSKSKTRWHTQPRTHVPPGHFLYLIETKSWMWEEEEEEEEEGEGEGKKSVRRPTLSQGAWVKQGHWTSLTKLINLLLYLYL